MADETNRNVNEQPQTQDNEDWKAVRDPFDEYEKRKKANSKK